MKIRRPGVIATRAVNQYRKRDVIAYLGVRHLLKSAVTQSDRWAFEIATELVRSRAAPSYFFSHHFKGVDGNGVVTSRQIAIPSPVEVLAETALLAECAGHPRMFQNAPGVFTYQLAQAWDRSGSFVNYSEGLRARQRAIGAACDKYPAGIVRYLDIRKFYPSIQTEDAKRAWARAASVLRPESRDLGFRLLADHALVAGTSSRGLLTGPMFSHLIANLVMRDLDEWAQKNLGAAYFRYVDDITLVGDVGAVKSAEATINERLKGLGLELHDDNSSKSISVSSNEWLLSRNDFEDEPGDVSWKALIGDLKRFLLTHPSQQGELHRALLDAGMRIPVLDYSAAVLEQSYVELVRSLLERSWFRLRSRPLSIRSLVNRAGELRGRFETELRPLLDSLARSEGYQQKRLIPKARYRAGRLVYLADNPVLGEFAEATQAVEGLSLHSEVLRATVTGDVSRVLSMGSNAVQSVAQPLRAGNRSVAFDVGKITDVELQGIAVLNFNGVAADYTVVERQSSPSDSLLRVSEDAVSVELMNSIDPFIRELSCLAGFGSDDHPALLESAFDEADELVLDAVDKMQESFPQNL